MRKIRLWTLGCMDRKNPSNSLIPGREAIKKLHDKLKAIETEKGDIDVVWGPDLTVQEFIIDEK